MASQKKRGTNGVLRALSEFMRSACTITALALLLLSGCQDEPAPDYVPQISAEEAKFGAAQHPRLLAELGGEYRGDEQSYVRQLGAKMAGAAGFGDRCTFTLVNSDVVNAFAVPGCYIYVTRGLMAIVTSEAELASVLGHEIGHIAGRHSERQQNRSLWSTLGVIAISLTGSEQLTRLAAGAAQLFTTRYSRTQEYESDELGIRYLREAGYDPYAAADMLDALSRQERFLSESGGRDEARSVPEWVRSHPLTAKRIARARQLARATGLADDALPEAEAPYLAAVDGLLYGDDPEQGFVIGRYFAHPLLRIAFEAPPGFTLANSPQAIGLHGPNGVRGEFSGGMIPKGGLPAYLDQVLAQVVGDADIRPGTTQSGMINGLPAITVPVRVATRQGTADIWLAAYDGGGGRAYHFVLMSRTGEEEAAAIERLFRSFRQIDAQEAAALHPRAIHIVTVAPGESAASLARRIADPHPLALLSVLNGGQPVVPGRRVKIVTAIR